ncbi:Phosphoglycerate kinase, cytosolic [Ananas comosus]|uniref:Phosphoglycerate kinase n=1 Tax=Ananas comosus TaxID=4615 RepID=A0A199V3L1_ANACO|nr:Phosphoglycerate kinase, cytosolic [Ananas comosus]
MATKTPQSNDDLISFVILCAILSFTEPVQKVSLPNGGVNDAFGIADRPHASAEGATKFLKPSVAGFLMQKLFFHWLLVKELDYLVGAVAKPKKLFAAIVGGSEVSTKIGLIESLLEKVDIVLHGGVLIFTFHKAQSNGVSLLLPADVVVADEFAADANYCKVVPANGIPDSWMDLDFGPVSIKSSASPWMVPRLLFGMDPWVCLMGTEVNDSQGETRKNSNIYYMFVLYLVELANLNSKGVTTIIGGGESFAAVEEAGLADKMSRISVGGSTRLELLQGKSLPGVLTLDDA